MADKLIKSIDFGGVDKYYPAPSVMQAVTTEGDGSAYTVTIPGITALTIGLSILVTPHTTSTSTAPTLNVNGLGNKQIKRRLSGGADTIVGGYGNAQFYARRAIRLTYDSLGYWVADDYTKPQASDLYGTVPIDKGGTGATTAEAALVKLGITYGTSDLTAGTSELATGSFYFVYE